MRLGCKLRDLNKLSQAQHHASHTLDAVTSHKFLTHTVASFLTRFGYSFNIASFVFTRTGLRIGFSICIELFSDDAIVEQLYPPISLSQI